MTELSQYRNLILQETPFVPNAEQLALIEGLSFFLSQRSEGEVFILNGYAGTGKTSIMGALVKALEKLRKKAVVMAPTGRAAKVAAKLAFGKASTIHKRLFRGNSLDPTNSSFFLAPNPETDTIFIVDEASLITDGHSLNQSLLNQLIRYVYSGSGCSMILVGDSAQLPPVGQTASHAMRPERLRELGLHPIFFTLQTPVRQASESGILVNATRTRNFLLNGTPIENFSILRRGFDDVRMVDPAEMLDNLSSSWATVGKEETIVISRSNFRANMINATIRRYLLDAEGPLIKGERIVISKNDYYWSKENKLKNFLANGELAEIIRVGEKTKKYGRWFADTELEVDGIETPVKAQIMLRSLVAEGPQIPREEMERFYNRVLAATEGELSFKIKAALENPYYNALQVKYGYCVTCHKAQGGQWKHVYIDLGGLPPEFSQSDFFRWLYTAITRATERVYFINNPFPEE
ncbi:MAG: AAA family ATPase [Muribaculaceae bacterium]|nr:AAA family ATPase [Muribaculaceae bacterium]